MIDFELPQSSVRTQKLKTVHLWDGMGWVMEETPSVPPYPLEERQDGIFGIFYVKAEKNIFSRSPPTFIFFKEKPCFFFFAHGL